MAKKLCIAGKNRIAVDALSYAHNTGLFELFACPTNSDCGVDTWQPSFLGAAQAMDINILALEDTYEIKGLTFISLQYDKIIDISRFKNANLLNIHFSLLPAYKGCFTTVWPIYFGEAQTGVSLHLIDNGIDTGAIVDQIAFPIEEETNARQLYDMYQDAGYRLFQKNIHRVEQGDFSANSQKARGSTYFSRNSLTELSSEINFSATAFQVKAFVNALFFPEYQTAMCLGDPIQKCKILQSRSTNKAGTILVNDSHRIRAATVDFDVELIKLNPAKTI